MRELIEKTGGIIYIDLIAIALFIVVILTLAKGYIKKVKTKRDKYIVIAAIAATVLWIMTIIIKNVSIWLK